MNIREIVLWFLDMFSRNMQYIPTKTLIKIAVAHPPTLGRKRGGTALLRFVSFAAFFMRICPSRSLSFLIAWPKTKSLESCFFFWGGSVAGLAESSLSRPLTQKPASWLASAEKRNY